MSLVDGRRPAFCWQSLDALSHIHAEAAERAVAPTISLYVGLTFLASRKHHQMGEKGAFMATRAEVSHASGLSPRSVHTYTAELERLGLIRKEQRSIEGRSASPTWELRERVAGGATLASADTQTVQNLPPTRAGDTSTTRRKKDSSNEESTEPIGFSDWLAYHSEVTGQRIPGASTKARATLARKFAELLGEGRTVEQIKLASAGAHSNEWLREKGLTKPKNVLVFDRIDGLIEDGEKARLVKPEPGRYTGRKRAEDQL